MPITFTSVPYKLRGFRNTHNFSVTDYQRIYGMSYAVSARDTAGSMTAALEITDVRPQAARNSVFYGQRSELQPCNTYGIQNFISYLLQIIDLSLPSMATSQTKQSHSLYFFFIFIVAPCILKIHLVSHTNKCTNYVIHYLKAV
jgi:hypothetical protein